MSSSKKFKTSIKTQIQIAIQARGPGAVFVPTDFLHLGGRQVVDTVLHRLVQSGVIQRLARGVYDLPKEHPVLGRLQPSAESLATALAGRDYTRLLPAGAYATNALGLSDQVPAKVVFLTDGPSRTIQIGSTTIQLRRTTARTMAAAGRLSGLLIQALREIGKENIRPEHIAILKRTIPAKERQALLEDIRLPPAWMHRYLRQLSEEGS